jgi:hypothetical protein
MVFPDQDVLKWDMDDFGDGAEDSYEQKRPSKTVEGNY